MSEATKLGKAEVMARYGDVPLMFSSYYKYSFTYTGVAPDGAKISATVGGDSADIYRYSVTPQSTIKLKDGEHYMASVLIGAVPVWDEYMY